MKFLKRIFLAILIIGLTAGTSFLVIKMPDITSWYNVKKNLTADKFDYETYEGWAFAYDALKRENNVLYSKAPKKKKEFAEFDAKGYPKKWLPDLIEDYGIVVQKPYSGNYVFKTQKDTLNSFYTKENDIIVKGLDSFKPVSKDVNANDANVIKALNSYLLLVDKSKAATQELDLKESQEKALGIYIKDSVGEEVFSDPIAYGELATKYLETNLIKYKPNYEAFVADSNNAEKINTENVTSVKKIMGIP